MTKQKRQKRGRKTEKIREKSKGMKRRMAFKQASYKQVNKKEKQYFKHHTCAGP
jgi:hypothetical protein